MSREHIQERASKIFAIYHEGFLKSLDETKDIPCTSFGFTLGLFHGLLLREVMIENAQILAAVLEVHDMLEQLANEDNKKPLVFPVSG